MRHACLGTLVTIMLLLPLASQAGGQGPLGEQPQPVRADQVLFLVEAAGASSEDMAIILMVHSDYLQSWFQLRPDGFSMAERHFLDTFASRPLDESGSREHYRRAADALVKERAVSRQVDRGMLDDIIMLLPAESPVSRQAAQAIMRRGLLVKHHMTWNPIDPIAMIQLDPVVIERLDGFDAIPILDIHSDRFEKALASRLKAAMSIPADMVQWRAQGHPHEQWQPISLIEADQECLSILHGLGSRLRGHDPVVGSWVILRTLASELAASDEPGAKMLQRQSDLLWLLAHMDRSGQPELDQALSDLELQSTRRVGTLLEMIRNQDEVIQQAQWDQLSDQVREDSTVLAGLAGRIPSRMRSRQPEDSVITVWHDNLFMSEGFADAHQDRQSCMDMVESLVESGVDRAEAESRVYSSIISNRFPRSSTRLSLIDVAEVLGQAHGDRLEPDRLVLLDQYRRDRHALMTNRAELLWSLFKFGRMPDQQDPKFKQVQASIDRTERALIDLGARLILACEEGMDLQPRDTAVYAWMQEALPQFSSVAKIANERVETVRGPQREPLRQRLDSLLEELVKTCLTTADMERYLDSAQVRFKASQVVMRIDALLAPIRSAQDEGGNEVAIQLEQLIDE